MYFLTLNMWPDGEREYLKLRLSWKTWTVSLPNADTQPSGYLGKGWTVFGEI